MSFSGRFILRVEQRDLETRIHIMQMFFPTTSHRKMVQTSTFAELFNESACFQAIRETVLFFAGAGLALPKGTKAGADGIPNSASSLCNPD
jgi:hypothetical protein